MTNAIFGNHAAVVVSRQEQNKVRDFYCDVLGFRAIRKTHDKDDFQLGGDDYFHLTVMYGDFEEESKFLRSGRAIYLEIKSDNIEATRQKIIDFGVTTIDVPDPHLYFQAPGGQVFRLVGIDEDLTKYERDVEGDEDRNAEVVAAVRGVAEHLSPVPDGAKGEGLDHMA